jgi:hypothetical protein
MITDSSLADKLEEDIRMMKELELHTKQQILEEAIRYPFPPSPLPRARSHTPSHFLSPSNTPLARTLAPPPSSLSLSQIHSMIARTELNDESPPLDFNAEPISYLLTFIFFIALLL